MGDEGVDFARIAAALASASPSLPQVCMRGLGSFENYCEPIRAGAGGYRASREELGSG